MKYGFIYITTNLVTGKQYVGQRKFRGKKDNEYLGSGTILNQSIQKHGKENFKREIICECSSKEELDIKETFYIQKFKTLWPIGYNLIEKGGGGDLLKNHPDRLEIIKKLKGKTSWNKGLTKETNISLQKVSLALKGKPKTLEHKLHISETQRKPEINNKKIQTRKNNNKPWHSEETKQKMSIKKIGILKTEKWKKEHSKKLKGKPRPKTEIERLRKFMLDPCNKIPCEICNKLLNKNNYNQHLKKCQVK